jgi:hypothetical protein
MREREIGCRFVHGQGWHLHNPLGACLLEVSHFGARSLNVDHWGLALYNMIHMFAMCFVMLNGLSSLYSYLTYDNVAIVLQLN